jgi:hypothetical protein
MRPRIEPIKVHGQIVHGNKVISFINKPLHIFCLELTKTITPIGRVVVRKEEEVVYHTRARLAV